MHPLPCSNVKLRITCEQDFLLIVSPDRRVSVVFVNFLVFLYVSGKDRISSTNLFLCFTSLISPSYVLWRPSPLLTTAVSLVWEVGGGVVAEK